MRSLKAGDLRHGTPNGYRNYFCRCEACRMAWSAYLMAWRRAHGVKPRRYGRSHGLASTYNHGCRCAECREAKMHSQRVRRAQRVGTER